MKQQQEIERYLIDAILQSTDMLNNCLVTKQSTSYWSGRIALAQELQNWMDRG